MSPDLIITEVCKFYEITASQLRSMETRRWIHARWVCWYLLYNFCDMSGREIAQLFDCTHKAIWKGIREVGYRIGGDPAIDLALRHIKAALDAHELARLQRRIEQILGGQL